MRCERWSALGAGSETPSHAAQLPKEHGSVRALRGDRAPCEEVTKLRVTSSSRAARAIRWAQINLQRKERWGRPQEREGSLQEKELMADNRYLYYRSAPA